MILKGIFINGDKNLEAPTWSYTLGCAPWMGVNFVCVWETGVWTEVFILAQTSLWKVKNGNVKNFIDKPLGEQNKY
jgi:hypothetical protein